MPSLPPLADPTLRQKRMGAASKRLAMVFKDSQTLMRRDLDVLDRMPDEKKYALLNQFQPVFMEDEMGNVLVDAMTGEPQFGHIWWQTYFKVNPRRTIELIEEYRRLRLKYEKSNGS